MHNSNSLTTSTLFMSTKTPAGWNASTRTIYPEYNISAIEADRIVNATQQNPGDLIPGGRPSNWVTDGEPDDGVILKDPKPLDGQVIKDFEVNRCVKERVRLKPKQYRHKDC